MHDMTRQSTQESSAATRVVRKDAHVEDKRPITVPVFETYMACEREMRPHTDEELEEMAILLSDSEDDAADDDDNDGAVIAGMGMRAALNLLHERAGHPTAAHFFCGYVA